MNKSHRLKTLSQSLHESLVQEKVVNKMGIAFSDKSEYEEFKDWLDDEGASHLILTDHGKSINDKGKSDFVLTLDADKFGKWYSDRDQSLWLQDDGLKADFPSITFS